MYLSHILMLSLLVFKVDIEHERKSLTLDAEKWTLPAEWRNITAVAGQICSRQFHALIYSEITQIADMFCKRELLIKTELWSKPVYSVI